MSQDELKKALQTARLAHERETELTYTITSLGALLRAVELLAERQDKPSEAGSGIVEAVQAALNMTKQDLETVLRREAELHVMLRNFALPTEPKALARELTGWQKSIEEDHARIAELEKRLFDLTVPMTVDGKTPGRFYHDTRRTIWANQGHSHIEWKDLTTREQEAEEHAANAVLRAFGQPRQTAQTEAVEALRRVRHAMFPNPHGPSSPEAKYQMGIIDNELAKLEGSKSAPTSDHVHELGSCSFCDKRDSAKPTAAEISAAWHGHQSYMDSAAAERVRALFDARPCFLCGYRPRERHA